MARMKTIRIQVTMRVPHGASVHEAIDMIDDCLENYMADAADNLDGDELDELELTVRAV
jgi:hypothetical protein